jgi:hypothetical protein
VVHDPLQTLLRGPARRFAAAGALLICLVLAGCGGSVQGSAAGATAAGETSSADVGESARSDTCEQWRQGTVAQRRGALVRLRKFAGSPVGSSAALENGHVLNDSRAYELFQSVCAKHFARAFKLYKLYERAAAFVGH